MLPVRVLIRARASLLLSLSLSVYLNARHIYFSGARAPRGRSPKVCRFKDQEEHKLKVMARCVRVRSDVDVNRRATAASRCGCSDPSRRCKRCPITKPASPSPLFLPSLLPPCSRGCVRRTDARQCANPIATHGSL